MEARYATFPGIKHITFYEAKTFFNSNANQFLSKKMDMVMLDLLV